VCLGSVLFLLVIIILFPNKITIRSKIKIKITSIAQ
jgi:hypothetical protein